MSEEILNMTFDRYTNRITLSGSESHFTSGRFSVLRSHNFVLTADEAPVWSDFLNTLKELYERDSFHIDFHGIRPDLEAFHAACRNIPELTVELYYDGCHVDNLPSVRYRANRILDMYNQIDLYNYSYLNRQFFLNPFQTLVNDYMNSCLKKPGKDALDLMNNLLQSGQLCVEDAWAAYRNEKISQEAARRHDRFLTERLNEMRDISLQLNRMIWHGMVFINPEKLLRLCREDLQRLTDSVAVSGKAKDPVSDTELQTLYCMFVRSCELAIKAKADKFVEKTNTYIKNVYGRELWKNTASLHDYPVLDHFTFQQILWNPVFPAEITDPAKLLQHLHDYAELLINETYQQYHSHFEAVWNELKQTNDHNLHYLANEIDLLQELTEDSQKRELHNRIKLEEESRAIESSQLFLEELDILLFGSR